MSSSDFGDAWLGGEAASGMCAFASTRSSRPFLLQPSASQTGPRLGQNSASDRIGSFSTPRCRKTSPSRYSTNPSACSGDFHSTESSSSIALARRKELSSRSGARATAIWSQRWLPALANSVLMGSLWMRSKLTLSGRPRLAGGWRQPPPPFRLGSWLLSRDSRRRNRPLRQV